MLWPGQQLINHCKSRLCDGWEPLGWAGDGQEKAVGRTQAGPGGLGFFKGAAELSLSSSQNFATIRVKPRHTCYLKAPNFAIVIRSREAQILAWVPLNCIFF